MTNEYPIKSVIYFYLFSDVMKNQKVAIADSDLNKIGQPSLWKKFAAAAAREPNAHGGRISRTNGCSEALLESRHIRGRVK